MFVCLFFFFFSFLYFVFCFGVCFVFAYLFVFYLLCLPFLCVINLVVNVVVFVLLVDLFSSYLAPFWLCWFVFIFTVKLCLCSCQFTSLFGLRTDSEYIKPSLWSGFCWFVKKKKNNFALDIRLYVNSHTTPFIFPLRESNLQFSYFLVSLILVLISFFFIRTPLLKPKCISLFIWCKFCRLVLCCAI